jgi:ABC-type nitrate/sulfonate/bicarbonate transport system permease component
VAAAVRFRPVARAAGRLATTAARWSLGLGIAVGVWALFLEVTDTPAYHAASPARALDALAEDRSLIIEATRVTAIEAGSGLAISVTVASVLAVAFVSSRSVERALLPFTLVFRSVPVVAIAPLLVLVVGRGLGTAVVCVTIVTFFPVLVNLSRGLRAASPDLLELFHVAGAGKAQVFRMVRVPSAVPFLFAGLRVAAANGVLGAMLAEWLTGSEGLGNLLVYASGRRQLGLVWATMAVATVGAIAVFRTTAWVERIVLARMSGTGSATGVGGSGGPPTLDSQRPRRS